MKFLCSEILDRNKIDDMDVLTFFKELKQRNKLDEKNIDYLIDLLKSVEEDKKIIEFFENYKLNKTCDVKYFSNSHISNKELLEIKKILLKSSAFVKNWKFVIRHLRVSDSQLNRIVSNHRDNLEEQIFEALVEWNNKDTNPSKQKIIEALYKCDLNETADRIAAI